MRRTLISNIKLSREEEKNLTYAINAYYLDIRGEKIGIIEQQQLLNLFTEELAPVIYNRALDDAKKWYESQQNNLESDFYMLYEEIKSGDSGYPGVYIRSISMQREDAGSIQKDLSADLHGVFPAEQLRIRKRNRTGSISVSGSELYLRNLDCGE